MIYIKNNNYVTYIGQPPDYIGDFNGIEHCLNNGKLLSYDPNHVDRYVLIHGLKNVIKVDILRYLTNNPFLKMIPKNSGIMYHNPIPININKCKKKKSRNKKSMPSNRR